jgi:hypothetical protein
MINHDPFGDRKLNRLQLMLYLIPFLGVIPAAWTLYRGERKGEQRQISRLSVNLTLGWLLFYAFLWTGATFTDQTLSFRFLYFNGLLTSGYILLSLGMIWRVWQQKN